MSGNAPAHCLLIHMCESSVFAQYGGFRGWKQEREDVHPSFGYITCDAITTCRSHTETHELLCPDWSVLRLEAFR